MPLVNLTYGVNVMLYGLNMKQTTDYDGQNLN